MYCNYSQISTCLSSNICSNLNVILLQVSYASGLSVAQGKELTPTQVQNEPSRVEWAVDDGAYYTLCMIGKS